MRKTYVLCTSAMYQKPTNKYRGDMCAYIFLKPTRTCFFLIFMFKKFLPETSNKHREINNEKKRIAKWDLLITLQIKLIFDLFRSDAILSASEVLDKHKLQQEQFFFDV